MPARRYGVRRLAIVFCSLLLLSAPALADTQPETPPAAESTGWTGAVGVGPIVFPRYTGGKASQTWLIPVISADYNNVLYIEPLRAGVYVWGSADRKMGLGLAIEPRFGFRSADGPRLAGMNKRGNSIEGGPAFDWDFGLACLQLGRREEAQAHLRLALQQDPDDAALQDALAGLEAEHPAE